MAEPLMPHLPETDEEIAAADPGHGAPEPAPGLGIDGEDPDTQVDDHDGPTTRAADTAPAAVRDADVTDEEPPFRTPQPDDVRRPGA